MSVGLFFVKSDGDARLTFLMGGAATHRTQKIVDLLKQETPDSIPPNSLDLNPVEC